MTEEEKRLEEARLGKFPWRKWGPYLSERQWGTVREDYSANGKAWDYFTHDQSRSRAYRWGEDGIAGISDDRQQLCFALALWNGKDPILKERLFGLTGHEGNHGEDVKEYYFYLENTPSHAYMKYLYKYPQAAYPYDDLVRENGRRTRLDPEYELLDTKIFDQDRYFDVFVEYAKAAADDLLIQITVANRGSETAPCHLLPSLWFRNTWAWEPGSPKPSLEKKAGKNQVEKIQATHPKIGVYFLYSNQPKEILFTENETNKKKVFGAPNDSAYVKDAFHEYLIHGCKEAVNPTQKGTKAAFHHPLQVKEGESVVLKLRLAQNGEITDPLGADFDAVFAGRKKEADDFYHKVTTFPLPDDMKNVQRQAFAGLLWNKQYYHYNVHKWLKGDPGSPPPPESRKKIRNNHWKTLDAADIFSMPDKWEYPWFAAWDLAFHAVTFALIDPEFAKHQMLLLMKEWYMHPDGQVPAYEWSFSDVNPPVHAWAAMRIYQIEANTTGRKDRAFLEKMFHKLSLNFTWWVNRKDEQGRNLFEGGFLGLDNIGAFDRTMGPPAGGTLCQTDGTGWMGMYALNLLQIALELAIENPAYEEMATKFFEHFLFIADAMNNVGEEKNGLWDEKKGFYYGVLTLPDGKQIQMCADTLLGVIPLYAVETTDGRSTHAFPDYRKRCEWVIENRPDLIENIIKINQTDPNKPLLISFASPEKLRRILEKVLDEKKFLSPYGIRSISKELDAHPFSLELGGKVFTLNYEPAESTTPLFGGNSNWRGPIWFPLNYLLIESLQKFHYFLGSDFKVEHPKGSGRQMSIWDVSSDLSFRMIKIFLKDEKGRRPVYGGIEKFQTDPHWRDYILFHEYFHGDNGYEKWLKDPANEQKNWKMDTSLPTASQEQKKEEDETTKGLDDALKRLNLSYVDPHTKIGYGVQSISDSFPEAAKSSESSSRAESSAPNAASPVGNPSGSINISTISSNAKEKEEEEASFGFSLGQDEKKERSASDENPTIVKISGEFRDNIVA